MVKEEQNENIFRFWCLDCPLKDRNFQGFLCVSVCFCHVHSPVIHLSTNSIKKKNQEYAAALNLRSNHCAPLHMRHIRLYHRGLDTHQLTAASRWTETKCL